MRVYIYDSEVFSDDWIVVFRDPEGENNHVVIHNDNHHLRAFLDQSDIVLGGFNNRRYDDWIVTTMLLGGSNVEVKRHNDYIIGKQGEPWEFPFVQYKKRPFKSFDLKHDIADEQLSLKAIEGNLHLPIVESSIPFDIDRPLTPEELEEVIRYCKNHVDATVMLYRERLDYINSKKIVGSMYGVPEEDAVGMTNATLSAKVLEAKKVVRSDERDYTIPACLDTDLIPDAVTSFFMQIRDLSIPDAKLFGSGKGSKGLTYSAWLDTSAGRSVITYAWGGVHGGKLAYTVEATEDRLIVNFDVASLYPNSMINFGYCSRSMADPEAYKKLVETRLKAKKAGDKEKANALKLVVNTVYGAMLNRDNDLADRRAGRSVCITNQLAMTQLMVMLGQRCSTLDFININTDGIMYSIDKAEDTIAAGIVDEWCEITGFEMERSDFTKVIQKDVNNYIGITSDGKLKTKGGYVSLYKGGSFKTNSLRVIHMAIVDYLVKGIPPEDTIRGCKDIFAFQQIVKTGGTYEGSYHYVDGQREPLQNVNRIYAVKDPRYGQVVKGKWITEKRKKDKATGKMVSTPVDPPVWSETTVPECPAHTYIDNENTLTVDDLDLDYYIAMAKDRIDKYINLDKDIERKINKIKEVIPIMATKANTTPETDFRAANIYSKLLDARCQFLEAGVKKTGVNRYAEFKYFTLDDIIPIKQGIFTTLGLVDVISFGTEVATLTLINVDNPDETIEFMSPLKEDESLIKNPIQKLGAVETYIRRYLYMLLLDIVEADTVDAVSDKPEEAEPKAAPVRKAPVTTQEREEIKKELINADGNADPTQIKAIKAGLKKLRDKDGDYESYINETVKALKAGISKTDAENLMIEIGKKVAE